MSLLKRSGDVLGRKKSVCWRAIEMSLFLLSLLLQSNTSVSLFEWVNEWVGKKERRVFDFVLNSFLHFTSLHCLVFSSQHFHFPPTYTYTNTWVNEYEYWHIQIHTDIYEYTNTRIHEYTNTRTNKLTNRNKSDSMTRTMRCSYTYIHCSKNVLIVSQRFCARWLNNGFDIRWQSNRSRLRRGSERQQVELFHIVKSRGYIFPAVHTTRLINKLTSHQRVMRSYMEFFPAMVRV